MYTEPNWNACITIFNLQGAIKTFHTDPVPIPEDIHSSYPSLLYMNVLSNRIDGLAASRRLLKCVIKTLKALGSKGVHTMLHSSHLKLVAYFTQLEFEDITNDKLLDKDVIVMGRPIW